MFEFKKQVSVTKNDYVKFNLSYNRKFKIKPIFFWIVIAIVTVLSYSTIDRSMLEHQSIPYFIFLFLFLLIAISTIIWGAFFLLKFVFHFLGLLLYKGMYNKLVAFKEAEILINEKGIQEKNEKACFSVVWDQVNKITEDENAFYFYYTKNAAFILPKRFIGSLDELYAFKEFLRQIQIRDIVTDYN